MSRDPYGGGGGGFVERIVGLALTMFVLVLALEALLVMIAPFLPWIGLAVLVAGAMGVWNTTRNRW